MKKSIFACTSLFLFSLGLSLGAAGCTSSTQPSTPAPLPGSSAGDPGNSAGAPANPPANPPAGEERAACPPPREATGMCAQMIAYAKNPNTGECCEYPTPCAAPEGWQTHGSLAECQQ